MTNFCFNTGLMSKLWTKKLSRRRLLGTAALGTAAVPLLHEAVPHQSVHDSLASAGEAGHGDHGSTNGAHKGSGHRGAVGKVDHAANGFDPTEILRDFDEGRVRNGVREWEIVAEDKEIEVAPGVKYAAWTYNGRVPGPTLRAREGEKLRINFVNGSSHPHTMHFHGIHRDVHDGIPGIGAGNIAPGKSATYEFDATPFGLHHYHCHSTPLADHIAKGLYGMFIVDPKQGRPEGGRARDGHERVRHELRPRERDLRGQHRRLRVRAQAGPRQARRAGADLPPEHPRVRPPELVPHPRELLRRLSHRARRSSPPS